jgi:SAM-dependent methyltransferase
LRCSQESFLGDRPEPSRGNADGRVWVFADTSANDYEMTELERYRESEQEKARTADLLRNLPRGARSVLDIGARDGHFSRLLTEYFAEVTALDLEKPAFQYPRVVTVAGDATQLDFPDNTFDCVFCVEVLEHIPGVERACHEISRVAAHQIVLGVPFKQDTRVGRTTCRACGGVNPPWGHVNRFDEGGLLSLFPGLRVISKSFVGADKEATNPISARLMDLAGNPWGTYNQEEPCIYCRAKLLSPPGRRLRSRVCSALAVRIDRLQALFTRPHGNWIHLVFSKDSAPARAIPFAYSS